MRVNGIEVPNEDVVRVVRDGSPYALGAFGRVLGLGQQEQQALFSGEFPRWACLGLGVVLGVGVGIVVAHHYPQLVKRFP